MIHWQAAGPSVLASFMASMVEFVEALTVVLAVGIVRGWRSALLGSAAALGVLVVLTLVLGPSLTAIPLARVQLFVGTLMLLFGLRWLRKAILRSAGVLALHDEDQAFVKETQALRLRGAVENKPIDSVAFATAFKIVMIEGIEVVFIVIAIGASGTLLWPAAIGALLALLLVMVLGFWLHRPLAKVPENALKFGVGAMLSAFGAFWAGEGLGLTWPGADWALLALTATMLAVAWTLVPMCVRQRGQAIKVALNAHGQAMVAPVAVGPLSAWRRLWDELAGLFIDDGWLAAGVVCWVLFSVAAQSSHLALSPDAVSLAFTTGLVLLLAFSVLRRARG